MVRRSWHFKNWFGTGKLDFDRGRPVVSDHDYWSWVGERWLPFVAELRAELRAVETRAALGFADNEHLPEEAKLLEWGRRAVKLTEEVRGYGHGTPNVVFQVLMRMGQYNGIGCYRFEEVPHTWSLDGFVRAIDGATRSSLYSNGSTAESRHLLGRALDAAGELRQTVEESAIANTFISGVMSARDGDVLLVGSLLRRLLVRVVRRRGAAVLRAMAGAAEGDVQELLWRLAHGDALPSLAEAASARRLFKRVDAVMGGVEEEGEVAVLAEACASVGVARESATWRAMLHWGVAPQSYGQLAPTTKLQAARFVEAAVDESRRRQGKAVGLQGEMADFVDFLREHPGRLWQGDRDRHLLMLSAGFMSKELVYVSRDEIDRRTRHRFLPVKWLRRLPLLEGEPNGVAPVVKREAGTEEISRFRYNAFPYDDEHGLGLGKPAGWDPSALDPLRLRGQGRRHRSKKGLQNVGHLGEALVTDATALLGNWFMCDIEKILTEFTILNMRGPRGARHRLLPGEAPVMVGQNPRAASSIGVTQHTQLSTASVGKWPAFRLRTPRPAGQGRQSHHIAGGVKAQVELVQMGRHEDSVVLRVELASVDQACHEGLLAFLHELHKELLLSFGGRQVDFSLLAAPLLPQTGAVLHFAPVAMLATTPEDRYIWLNPDTGERSDSYGLPVQTVDFSQGRGNWMVFGEEAWAATCQQGKALLASLYDFARKPGIREVMVRLLTARLSGWTDLPGQAVLDPFCPAKHESADAFWDVGRSNAKSRL